MNKESIAAGMDNHPPMLEESDFDSWKIRIQSNGFRVFNSRTRIVEENLHIRFSDNTPNVIGSRPDWLFDIDALTRTMNYELIVVGTQSNGFAGTKASDNAGQARKETKPIKYYILLPLWTINPPFSQDPKSSHDDGYKPSSDDGKKIDEDLRKESKCKDQENEDNVNNTNNVNTVSSTINAAGTNRVNVVGGIISNELPFNLNMPALEDKLGFIEVKTASTTLKTQKPLLKDEDGKKVDVHMYKSMIGSLTYLTSSRPDIMFAVCACARIGQNEDFSKLMILKFPLTNTKLLFKSSYTSTVKSSKEKNGYEKLNEDTDLKINEEPVDQEDQAFLEELKRLKRQKKKANDAAKTLRKTFAQSTEDMLLQAGAARASSTNYVNTSSSPVNAASTLNTTSTPTNQDDSYIPSLEDIYEVSRDGIFTCASYDDEGAMADFTNLETTVNCDEFETLMKNRFQMSSMGELTFFLGLQVKQKKDGIFISRDKYVAEILKKFDFLSVKTASTLIETKKPLVKDEEAADVHVHLYRSMIGSLMYLTASRPDIMYAVCACYRFQVTPKTSHLQAVKRIFRYLKGQTKLGLWYPKEADFDLEAYPYIDYAGANLDKKSTIGEVWLDLKSCCWYEGQTTTGKELSNLLMAGRLPKTTLPTKLLKVNAARLKLTTARVYAAEVVIMSTRTFAKTHSLIAYLEKSTKSEGFAQIIDFLNGSSVKFVQLIINHQLGDMAHHKEIFDTPSITKKVFAKMKRKHNPKRKHPQESEVPLIESLAKENLPSPSNDPQPSGEDSLKLKELMDLCTKLSNQVLELESEVIDIKSTYQERIEM
nr:hypothetical protein [Tanacetum cinerariifolium]